MIPPIKRSRGWLGKCSASIPIIDLLTLGILLSLVVATGLLLVIRDTVPPIEGLQSAEVQQLHTAREKLRALSEIANLVPPEIDIPDTAQTGNPNLLNRLRNIGAVAEKLSRSRDLTTKEGYRIEKGVLQTLTDAMRRGHLCAVSDVSSEFPEIQKLLSAFLVLGEQRTKALGITAECLRGQLAQQLAFWDAQKANLCKLDRELPASPQFPINASLGEYLAAGRELATYRNRIWKLHALCIESKKEVIGEDLLKFKYDRYNAFDMTSEAVMVAKDRIRRLVDKHHEFRNIYVEGHCDPQGGDEYNYRLSFMRALYVSGIIRRHLDAQGLEEGGDYFLHIIGYSKRRPLPRKPGEPEAAWYSRLRRIELGFQRIHSS
uniref:OmpA family protein n=1 Tax=Candidatus Kentrum sp. DK TaxID=2126562 RepID=A0A450T1S2_9GAMM|nr:MAG: OmpA family protein [Candidatus Kentron sp. DK]